MLEIKLHNTLTGNKDIFRPIHPNQASVYNCGPTVYFFAHIGNMRAYVFADTLKRTLKYFGYSVKQIINITDVGHLTSNSDSGEDKVEETAKKEGKTAKEITAFYEDAFHKDMADLNIDTGGTVFPKATEHIKEQIELVKILEEKGFAYNISDGIYFDTGKFEGYGKLGGISEQEEAEGRIEKNNEKRNQRDFALWKFSKPGEERLQEWESPWGLGFPGWHIECSTMSRKYLGQPFDIHTGGIDHIPVHHNNEIAQSEAAYGVPLANYWLHNEFLSVEGEKMSKSLGNVFTISDLKTRKIHPLSFRYWLLTAHYRSPANFTWDSVLGAQTALEKLVFKYSLLPETSGGNMKKFEEAISDNLNMPVAISLLQEAASKEEVDKMDEVLGLNIKKLAEQMGEIPEEILEIKKERDRARQNKEWQRGDELREEIEKEGYVLEDKEKESVIRKKLEKLIETNRT